MPLQMAPREGPQGWRPWWSSRSKQWVQPWPLPSLRQVLPYIYAHINMHTWMNEWIHVCMCVCVDNARTHVHVPAQKTVNAMRWLGYGTWVWDLYWISVSKGWVHRKYHVMARQNSCKKKTWFVFETSAALVLHAPVVHAYWNARMCFCKYGYGYGYV